MNAPAGTTLEELVHHNVVAEMLANDIVDIDHEDAAGVLLYEHRDRTFMVEVKVFDVTNAEPRG